ncbi:LOW QUALITY PROTEIN: F-box domain-containing protein, partial [Cephalotus follicularis]
QTPLICGLSDDIAFFCLARVPRNYHAVIKCVSRRWRDLVCSDEWHAYRRKHNLHETWIYALCRYKFEQVCYVLDPNSSRRHWKRIPGFPSRSLKRKGMGFEALWKKIYLLGGCGWMEDATEEVYCYDASMNSWTEAACLSMIWKLTLNLYTFKCYLACEVLDEKIHAIGGLGSKSSTQSWDTYDPYTNIWKCDFDPNIIPEIEDSIVMDRKIHIRTNITPVTSRASAVFYEPSSGMWQRVDIDMAVRWQGPAVNVDGTFYVLDQYGTRLMMWQKEIRKWVPVERLSSLVTRPPCRLVAIGKSIFVIGKG